jgi:TetR/AcrR family transcriptional regulator, cholesterol catabolism regulator
VVGAVAGASAPAVETETSAQRARRQRIIQATLALASRGGYEAVQMREVAERSEVALGTLYRYFPSKVHLLVSAMAFELDSMRGRVQRRSIPGDTPRDRVAYVLERTTRSLQKDPNLTEAMIRAMMAADATVATEVTGIRSSMGGLITAAMHPDGDVTDEDLARSGILQDVWFARQIAWLGGRIDADQVWADIERAIDIVLGGY